MNSTVLWPSGLYPFRYPGPSGSLSKVLVELLLDVNNVEWLPLVASGINGLNSSPGIVEAAGVKGGSCENPGLEAKSLFCVLDKTGSGIESLARLRISSGCDKISLSLLTQWRYLFSTLKTKI